MRRSLLVIPPLVKSLAGPPAGPSWLAGVARSEGVPLDVVDLNAAWLRWLHPVPLPDPGGPSGDHAQPLGHLALPAHAWKKTVERPLFIRSDPSGCEQGGILAVDFEQLDWAAQRAARGWLGSVWRRMLGRDRPRFVGVSVLSSGQVMGGLVATVVVKQLWPGVPVVWGGAHVTALAPEIAREPGYGTLVDGFVAGYAEGTFRQMLRGDPLSSPGVFRAGAGSHPRAVEETDTVPAFSHLGNYGQPRLTLPVQTTRGCAFAQCQFCTYPAVEGRVRRLPQAAVVGAVEQALLHGAEIGVRDALATTARLELVAGLIDGRTRWAATTRLLPRLGRERLRRLTASGLRTLELGVESIDPDILARLQKRQPVRMVEQWLDDARGLDLHLVLNVMFGFPGQTHSQAVAFRRYLDIDLPRRFPRTRFTVERNLLQLERRAPMAACPERHGIEIGQTWPWSSVMAWNAPSWRRDFSLRTPLIERMRAAL